MNNKGLTLIELMVVVAIVGILAVALGFTYIGWQGAYNVERATKDIYSDLIDARGRAISRGQAYFIDFPPVIPPVPPPATAYRMSEDDSNGIAKGDGNLLFEPQANPLLQTANTDETVTGFPKTVPYTLNAFTRNDAAATTTAVAIAAVRLDFDKRGIITSGAGGLFALGTTTGIIRLVTTPNIDPDYDCIVISEIRLNMGKWNVTTTTCDAK